MLINVDKKISANVIKKLENQINCNRKMIKFYLLKKIFVVIKIKIYDKNL